MNNKFESHPFSSSTNWSDYLAMLIWDALRNLVPFVQFIKREKNPLRSVTFSKVAGCSLNFTNSNAPPWVFFMFFKLHKWSQITQSITYKTLKVYLCFSDGSYHSSVAYIKFWFPTICLHIVFYIVLAHCKRRGISLEAFADGQVLAVHHTISHQFPPVLFSCYLILQAKYMLWYEQRNILSRFTTTHFIHYVNSTCNPFIEYSPLFCYKQELVNFHNLELRYTQPS